jgi:hypothetical protein
MHYAKTAHKLREQIVKFSGVLSSGLPKTARRFILEMIYGIQAWQSVRLTEIGRALEEKISLRKTEYRLCRQLGREEPWDHLTVMTPKSKTLFLHLRVRSHLGKNIFTI